MSDHSPPLSMENVLSLRPDSGKRKWSLSLYYPENQFYKHHIPTNCLKELHFTWVERSTFFVLENYA